MKHKKLSEALDEISDRHILEATKKAQRIKWMMPLAATLAAVIALFAILNPLALQVSAINEASSPRITKLPDSSNYTDRSLYLAAVDVWQAERINREENTAAILEALAPFFLDGSKEFLSGSGNTLWSPANAAIGLAMLTELTAEDTQGQLLDLLGAENLSTLRSGFSALWEAAYCKDGKEICTLANSLWLEQGLQYNKETLNALSHYYYASVHQRDLGTSATDRVIGSWVNQNTGGLLKSATDRIQLDPSTVLALYSTLYLQSKWNDEFNGANNTNGNFHATTGDRTVTYMNKALYQTNYYWGDTFGAVSLSLQNGCRMWFILPDEGLTTAEVLQNSQYLEMLLSSEWENSKYMKVNLSVPKFDVSQTQDLKEGLRNMGLTDIFSPDTADFSAITGDTPLVITSANQSVRVQIDEKGVTAAAYIEFPAEGAAQPPEEIIDFILDRPFLFVITNDRIPLVTGVVNEP